jgi:hypothetical protein
MGCNAVTAHEIVISSFTAFHRDEIGALEELPTSVYCVPKRA